MVFQFHPYLWYRSLVHKPIMIFAIFYLQSIASSQLVSVHAGFYDSVNNIGRQRFVKKKIKPELGNKPMNRSGVFGDCTFAGYATKFDVKEAADRSMRWGGYARTWAGLCGPAGRRSWNISGIFHSMLPHESCDVIHKNRDAYARIRACAPDHWVNRLRYRSAKCPTVPSTTYKPAVFVFWFHIVAWLF